MRSKTLGATLIVLSALGVCAAPAGAIVANTAGGRVGYLPLNGPGSASVPKGFTEPSGEPPLVYHGGPVMHSHAAYAIFWAPIGFSFPTGYTAAIENFLKNVAADSGKPSNVYSVSAQYTDGTGHAAYSDTFGGSVTDANAYPGSGTCPTYKGVETFTACITDAKLEDEVESVVNAQGWPDGLGAEYYVVFPPHVGSCFGTTPASGCFDKQFCAYHSFSEPAEDIYANISYSPGDPEGCGVEEYPSGPGNGNVDDTLSSLSHEANESITDPTLEAWFDVEGFEDGDECRNSSDDYGVSLGGAAGALFNQSIAAGHYFLQQEWSNDTEDCAQRVAPAQPQIADPGVPEPGQLVSFNGAGTTPGAGGIVSFEWDFDDGGSASIQNPSHTFVAAGTFTVTLTVKDDGDFSYSTSREVVVAPPLLPVASLSALTDIAPGGVTLNGTVDPKSRHTTFHFEFGLTTAYGSSTPLGDAGSGSGAVPITAGLTGLAPATTYHYRLVATNAIGTEKTTDAVFATAPAPALAAVSSSPPNQLPPIAPTCTVPKLTGKTLGAAKSALAAAHCTLGTVTKPKAKHRHGRGQLVVKSSTPAAGAKPPGGKVNLTLGPKPRPKKHHH